MKVTTTVYYLESNSSKTYIKAAHNVKDALEVATNCVLDFADYHPEADAWHKVEVVVERKEKP